MTTSIDSSLTLWAPEQRDGLPLLVLLHGYGSDERDLYGLRQFLPDGIAVASIAAPSSPPPPQPGRAWFPMGTLGEANDAIGASARAVREWVDAEAASAPSVALLGFSQGAAVALECLRQDADRFCAALALSGVVSPVPHEGDAALAKRRPPVFWGRGALDTIFPEQMFAHTAQWLEEHTDLTAKLYQGLGHSVSQEELVDIAEFVATWRDTSAKA